MCVRTARPAPRRRKAVGVRIDLISPCVGSSSLSAPQPNKTSPSHTVQNVTSGDRSFNRSSAWTSSRGESSCMWSRCSRKSAWTTGRERSSSSTCTLRRRRDNVRQRTREPQHKRTPYVGDARHRQLAAEELCQSPADAEPQAHALRSLTTQPTALPEHIEHARKILRRNAPPGIRNLDQNVS